MSFYRETVLPWILDTTAGSQDLKKIRDEVLRDVRGRVLEIGFGTGLNLPSYPAAIRELTVVEPSAGMNRRAAKRARRWGGTIHTHALAGERLPFEDGAFDSVVMTLTLCSVDDPGRVLAEARRVLAPGGALHFFEHVGSDDPAWRRRQDRLNGLQNRIAGGCNLNRDSEAAIVTAGFRIERIERRLMTGVPRWLAKLEPLIWGRAVRD